MIGINTVTTRIVKFKHRWPLSELVHTNVFQLVCKYAQAENVELSATEIEDIAQSFRVELGVNYHGHDTGDWVVIDRVIEAPVEEGK